MTKEAKIIKIVDPVVQSLLFVLFCYMLDGGQYRNALLIMLGWQIISAVVNSFLVFSRKQTIPRIINFVIMVVFIAGYLFTKKVPDRYFEIIGGDGSVMVPIREVVLTAVGVLISFWYYFICFREIRYYIKRDQEKNKA